MGVITLNGITSTSIGLVVEVPPDYEIPERIYEKTPVPGRNGEVVMDTGSFSNVDRTYQVAIGQEDGDFSVLSNKIAGWLYSGIGYVRLEDSYEPLYYKEAMYIGTNSIANILQQAGRATLTFNRKPQRFLKTGDTPIIATGSKTITNPTSYTSKPIIKINGNGSGVVNIGQYRITISTLNGYMYVNSDIEDCYKDAFLNTNEYVTLSNGFPMLHPGNTQITFSGGISSVEVVPRWWVI